MTDCPAIFVVLRASYSRGSSCSSLSSFSSYACSGLSTTSPLRVALEAAKMRTRTVCPMR